STAPAARSGSSAAQTPAPSHPTPPPPAPKASDLKATHPAPPDPPATRAPRPATPSRTAAPPHHPTDEASTLQPPELQDEFNQPRRTEPRLFPGQVASSLEHERDLVCGVERHPAERRQPPLGHALARPPDVQDHGRAGTVVEHRRRDDVRELLVLADADPVAVPAHGGERLEEAAAVGDRLVGVA